MRAKLFILSVFILLISPLAGQSVAEKADAYLQATVANDAFSGAVHIARGKEVLFIGGYGQASISLDVPNTPENIFRLGSITKQFTAMAVLQLVEAGKLQLEGLITDYIPEYPAEPHGGRVTIHQLLNHTSGIPSYTDDEELFGSRACRNEVPAEFIKHFWDKNTEFEPGTKWSYNNSAYYLLGYLIERVSGQPYDEYLQQHLFQPLELNHTGFEKYQAVIPGMVQGYSRLGEHPAACTYIIPDIAYSAGAIYSNVEDLYRWHQALTAKKLISEESYGKMFTNYMNNYGYGWGILEWFGHKMYAHSGGIDGFSTFTLRFPEEEIYISVLSNYESARVGAIAKDLAAITLGEPYELPQKREVVKINPELFKDYEGTYNLFPGFDIAIFGREGRFYAQATNQQEFEIFPESETVFFLKVLDAKLEFIRGADGKVDEMILHQNGQRPGKRVK